MTIRSLFSAARPQTLCSPYLLLTAWVFLNSGSALPLHAQSAFPSLREVGGVDRLPTSRPEVWALRYFTSVTLFTGFGEGASEARGFALALEGGSIPHLNLHRRTVGFYGTKEEDLNKSPAFGRLRISFQGPGETHLSLGWVPPVELNGARPHLLAVAVERPFAHLSWARFTGRLMGQVGSVRGDFTCPARQARAGSDPTTNPWGCLEASRDRHRQAYWGGQLTATSPPVGPGVRLHLGVAAARQLMAFQVNARYGDVWDRTRLEAEVTGFSVLGGAGWSMGNAGTGALQLFYSPMAVRRRPDDPLRREGLLNLRFVFGYRP
ncbi:MAG: hypothetical protein WEA09_04605 [Gemmatimonadota bacterium]